MKRVGAGGVGAGGSSGQSRQSRGSGQNYSVRSSTQSTASTKSTSPASQASQASQASPQNTQSLLRAHGGYRQLKSFQVAQLVYDLTVRFCDRFIDRRSRTHDQMVQAARSGVQNIAEGSEAAATSSKIELKLTQIARASLEELKLDYEDFLRQRKLPCWDRQHPLRQELVDARLTTADQVAIWVARKARQRCTVDYQHTGQNDATALSPATHYPELAANAILTLATVAGFLLDRQVQQLAAAFEQQGGFTERLYRMRSVRRTRL